MDYVIFTDTSANLPDKGGHTHEQNIVPGASGGDSLPRLGGV